LLFTEGIHNFSKVRITAITIDNQGNKWFTTKAGVSKFDGTTWTTYTTANSGLAWNYVSAIAIDGQGNKWFGTPNGVATFGTTWTTYTSTNSGLAIGSVASIAIDGQGNKWFGVYGGGVSMLN
jgi:ligand-binding sensor domain-containing protein